MKTLFTLLFLITGSMLYAQSNAPVLELIDKHHDFGNIVEGEQVRYEFRFRNAGIAPLFIQNVNSPCGCTVPEWPKTAILSGDTASIPVIFSSAERDGPFVKKLVIKSNSTSANTVISIAGIVVPQAENEEPKAVMVFERLSIDLGELHRIYTGTDFDPPNIKDSFKLVNKGTGILVINAVNSSYGGLTPKYKREPILPGETTYIKFYYSLAQVGSFTKQLTVRTNVGQQMLFVKGLIKPELGPIAYFPDKVIETDPLILGKTYTLKVPMINYGDKPLKIVSVDGELEAYFSPTVEMDYGDTAWISTQITPDHLGQFEYILTINHNGRTKKQDIKLIGEVRKEGQ